MQTVIPKGFGVRERAVEIGWGLGSDGRLHHIDSVANGLKCNCVCPECGTKLVANQGDRKKKAHHFSHYSATSCDGESILHLAAKQAIEDAVKSKQPLFTPFIEGACHGIDAFNKEVSVPWKVSYKNLVLTKAQQETIFTGLITDVLVETERKPGLLAVEIFVTHKKDDIDTGKYTALGLDCIEIDLSECKWNINGEELSEQVLQRAPRRWVYSSCPTYAIKEAELKLEQLQDQRREDFQHEFVDTVTSFINEASVKGFSWPQQDLLITTSNSLGNPITVKDSVKRSLKCLSPDIDIRDIGCCTTGIISGHGPVPVYFMLDADIKYNVPEGPYVVFEYTSIAYPVGAGFYFEMKWINVDSWLSDKLARLKRRSQQMTEHSNKSIQKQLDFAANFAMLSVEQQHDHVLKKLGFEHPPKYSYFDVEWNSHRAVWKGLVLTYFIMRNKSKSICVQDLADNSWLLSALGVDSTNDQHFPKRVKMLQRWFNSLPDELVKFHFVKHRDGTLHFNSNRASSSLLKLSFIQ